MNELNVMALVSRLQSEADAWEMLEELRWAGEPVCAHCGCETVHYVAPKQGSTRATRTGAQSARRVWKCHKRGGGCGRQFTVLVGTVFESTKIPLRTWLFVLFEMVSSKNGVAAREIERKYGLTAKSAWFMLHRIREAMDEGPLAEMFAGTVIADETYVGGSISNRHKTDRVSRLPGSDEPVPVTPGQRPKRNRGPADGKTTVMTLADETTGRVRSRVIPDVTGATLRKAIAEHVDMAETTLITDEARGYVTFADELADHRRVNHSDDEYVRYDDDMMISTNRVENFFSQLKRSLDGTHHHVSREHLGRYLAEFDYRYSTRDMTDTARLDALMGQVAGKRLTYRALIGGIR